MVLFRSFFACRSKNEADSDDVEFCDRHPDDFCTLNANNIIKNSNNDDFIIAMGLGLIGSLIYTENLLRLIDSSKKNI